MGKLVIGNETYTLDVDRYKIESIAFFGSKYTGLDDDKSDVDLLFIIDDVAPNVRKQIIESISRDLNIPKHWISMYTKSTFTNRTDKGDLFVWCLKVESKVLYSKSGYIERCFKRLKYPQKLSQQLKDSQTLMGLYYSKFKEDKISAEELMNSVAHFVRDTCIRVCYMHGVIIFDKLQPIKYCLTYNDFETPFTLQNYEELLQIKRNYKYKEESKVFYGNPKKYLKVWYEIAERLFENSINYARQIESSDFRDPLRYFVPHNIKFNCKYLDLS